MTLLCRWLPHRLAGEPRRVQRTDSGVNWVQTCTRCKRPVSRFRGFAGM